MSTNLQAVKQRFGIIGRSAALDQALSTAVRVAPTDLSVLISGESGVGKEVFSKIIHAISPRKHNKFIAINCGAIPEGTINSELFGHEKGAFTGATSDRKGYFETVDGGTIFLDEIGEMPLDTQAFLLRVLETGEFIRVGSSKVQKTDVRVIAATNIDLLERVEKNKFREDLYYRLNIVPIGVPALRDRSEDIYMLFRKFIVDFAERYRRQPIELDDRARTLLEVYSWPGNIRELKNMAEQLSVMTDQQDISAEYLIEMFPHLIKRNLPAIRKQENNMQEREILYQLLFDMKNDLNDLKSLVFGLIQNNDLSVPSVMHNFNESDTSSLPSKFPSYQAQQASSTPSEDIERNIQLIIDQSEANAYAAQQQEEEVDEILSLETMERDMIQKALTKHKGRRKDAASELGISERTLYRKIKTYELSE